MGWMPMPCSDYSLWNDDVVIGDVFFLCVTVSCKLLMSDVRQLATKAKSHDFTSQINVLNE
jgi:hypothetical protein